MSDLCASKASACRPMSAKFLADANFDLVILAAAKRREPALDFQTAQAAGLAGEVIRREEEVMGQVKTQVTLRNAREVVLARLGHLASEQVHSYTVEALVDTGATRLTIPAFVADQLGMIRLGHTDAEYADGRGEEVETTEGVLVEILGRTVIRDAMVLGTQVLIGVTVLEDLDLLVDCKRQRVIPPPHRPDQPVFRV